MLLAQVGDESGEIGKGLRVDGEGPIAVLVVDVKVHSVRGNLIRAKPIGNFAHLRLRRVAVTRLLESKCPQGRERRRAGEVCVSLNDFFWGGTIQQVVIERTAFRAESIRVAGLLAEVKPGAPRVVEKEPVTASLMNGEEEGNRLVERIDGFLWTYVGIPERVGLASPVEGAGFIAQSEIVLVAGHGFVRGESAVLEPGWSTDGIGANDLSREIPKHDAQGIALDAQFHRCGAKSYVSRIAARLHVHGLAASRGKYRPRSVLWQGITRCHAHADDVVGERRDAHQGGARLDVNAIRPCPKVDDLVERDDGRCRSDGLCNASRIGLRVRSGRRDYQDEQRAKQRVHIGSFMASRTR